jgi:hypothetical protein
VKALELAGRFSQVPRSYSSTYAVNVAKYSTLSRHVRIHIEPSLCRHRNPSSCLFEHLRIWKRGRNISAQGVCTEKSAITDVNVDNLFLVVSLGKHSTPGEGVQRTAEKVLKVQIRTLGQPRANDPTESSQRSSILLNSERRSTHRMVTCAQVSCWAAHPKEHLVVYSPRKTDQSVTGSADCHKLSALPRSLEELPVKRTSGHVESAWVDENLTTCSRTETVRD